MDLVSFEAMSSSELDVLDEEGERLILYYSGWSKLSNFNRSIFKEDKRRYLNVQQYVEAHKALLFNRNDLFQRVLACSSPKACCDLTAGLLVDDQWHDEHGKAILERGIRLKFTQSEPHRKFLVATGETRLAFATPFDSYYGIGHSIANDDSLAPKR